MLITTNCPTGLVLLTVHTVSPKRVRNQRWLTYSQYTSIEPERNDVRAGLR